jgi:DHA3 family macrolide efflux protein-like MFS transporter
LQRTFGVGATGLGIVDSAQGVGMVVSGLALGLVASRLNRTAMAGWAIIIIGLFIAGMGLAPAFGYVIALSFAVGLALVPAQSALVTMMQLAVPDLKRGRVGSAMNALTMAAGLVSMGLAAVLGEVIGLRTMYAIAGLITMSAGVVGLFVLTEPEPHAAELAVDRSAKAAEALAD